MMQVEHQDDPIGMVYPVPRVHAIGDWVAAILAVSALSPIVLMIAFGLLIGATGWPFELLYVLVPASIMVSAFCLRPLIRGKVGLEWRLTDRGIERGRGKLQRCVPYERVRQIEMQRAPRSADGQENSWRQRMHEQRLAGNSMLTVHLDHGSLKVYVKTTDAIDCFESLRQLCPHASAIDIAGDYLVPASDPS